MALKTHSNCRLNCPEQWLKQGIPQRGGTVIKIPQHSAATLFRSIIPNLRLSSRMAGFTPEVTDLSLNLKFFMFPSKVFSLFTFFLEKSRMFVIIWMTPDFAVCYEWLNFLTFRGKSHAWLIKK
jgi:hypothetical protein